MKAMVLHEIGGPDKLSYEDAPDPEPGSGETVVKLHAAALNRRDVFVTRGQYPGAKPEALPVILGSDGAGEVVARGEGASGPDEGTGVTTRRSLAESTVSSGSPTTAPSPSSSRCPQRTSFRSPRTSRTRRPPRYPWVPSPLTGHSSPAAGCSKARPSSCLASGAGWRRSSCRWPPLLERGSSSPQVATRRSRRRRSSARRAASTTTQRTGPKSSKA